jgi:hypothetical protein
MRALVTFSLRRYALWVVYKYSPCAEITAVAALRDVRLDPRQLQRVPQVGGQALDGHHLLARGPPHGGDARPDGLGVEVDGAGAAQGHAAAELGAGEAQGFAEDPEQRRVAGDVHRAVLAIDVEVDHACYLPRSAASWNGATLPIKGAGEGNYRRIVWRALAAAKFVAPAATPRLHVTEALKVSWRDLHCQAFLALPELPRGEADEPPSRTSRQTGRTPGRLNPGNSSRPRAV